jgi:hypothetical protein
MLAGLPVRDELVLELARLVDDTDLADKLEDAYRREVKVLALTIPERTTILAALHDPPAGLEELRGVLLREPTVMSPCPLGTEARSSPFWRDRQQT